MKVINSRVMPPWLVEPGFGEFAGNRRQDARTIALFQKWADQGEPEGNPADLPKEKANDPELIELLSNEKQVNAKTPPALLVHGIDDAAVPVSNSDNYAAALKKAGVEVEFVRVEHGPHGFGLKDFWTGKCVEWLRRMKF